MPHSPFLRLMLVKLLRETRLIYALGLLVTCSISCVLGFYAGSSKDGNLRLNGHEAVTHEAAGQTAASVPWANAAPALVPASASPVSASQQFFQRTQPASTAAAGTAPVYGAGAAVAAGSSFVTPTGEASAVSYSSSIPEVPDAPKIMIPLVFQNVNPAAIGLSSTQVAGIDQMRADFNSQLSGRQNPADPQYAQTWASAQAQVDDRLRSLLGWEQFNQYQINAFRHK